MGGDGTRGSKRARRDILCDEVVRVRVQMMIFIIFIHCDGRQRIEGESEEDRQQLVDFDGKFQRG